MVVRVDWVFHGHNNSHNANASMAMPIPPNTIMRSYRLAAIYAPSHADPVERPVA